MIFGESEQFAPSPQARVEPVCAAALLSAGAVSGGAGKSNCLGTPLREQPQTRKVIFLLCAAVALLYYSPHPVLLPCCALARKQR